MKFCILMGSPRLHKNTAELLKPFIAKLLEENCEVEYITLADKDIRPCLGCYHCQNIAEAYGCVLDDDVPAIMNSVMACDCLVLATPIYTWYCTAPMKALLDRHYGLNKYYGSASGSLWADKSVAIVATHGYKAAYACDPFEIGIQRLCKHSKLNYLGLYSVRDEDNIVSFQTTAAKDGARAFAAALVEKLR